ncbi:hypothetical protein DSL72_000198 [Monilinia vaccinii-corymbosi]|uniref:Uncharacterized protein n=1 Tax=Monilinia vaccinii-corymbosi TaxID=61207 RepID=A0A8A3P2B7_9HELO|nr:hypothetical protein DSL72_000198 [Monilinia vaccinii-corymbosi]
MDQTHLKSSGWTTAKSLRKSPTLPLKIPTRDGINPYDYDAIVAYLAASVEVSLAAPVTPKVIGAVEKLVGTRRTLGGVLKSDNASSAVLSAIIPAAPAPKYIPEPMDLCSDPEFKLCKKGGPGMSDSSKAEARKEKSKAFRLKKQKQGKCSVGIDGMLRTTSSTKIGRQMLW